MVDMDDAEVTTGPTAELDARYSAPDARPTPWSVTLAAIRDAELFWLTTVRADGRPHVTPLPAVWRDATLHFCTGAEEQKARNLAQRDRCALITGTNRWNVGLDVVVEGVATRVADTGRLQVLADAWETKYDGDWHFDVADGAFSDAGGTAWVYAVRPTKVLAFAKGPFAQTRYRFDLQR